MIIQTKNAPKAIGPYSQAVLFNDVIYTSGQLGINPETQQLEEGLISQTTQALKNIKAILEAAGSDMNHVLKTTIYIKNMADFSIVNDIYSQYFSVYPARSCVEVSSLPKNGLIEIECIACIEV